MPAISTATGAATASLTVSSQALTEPSEMSTLKKSDMSTLTRSATLPYATAEPMLCLARVPAGIPYGAPDGWLTDLFVLVCCHDERQHLLALARLALLFNSDLPDALREAEDAEEALEIVLDTEQQMLRKRS